MGTIDTIHIYVVRHGMTKWNKEKRYLGHTNQQLLPKRLADLNLLKKYLSKLSFDRIYTSDLDRCRETLAYLLPDQPARMDYRIREINFGDWEGNTHYQLREDPHYKKWLEKWQTVTPPNGENYQSFGRRIALFMDELLQKNDSNVLLVTHGGVIRELMNQYLTGLSFKDTKIAHGQGVKLQFNQHGGDWRCSSWSAVPILEKGSW